MADSSTFSTSTQTTTFSTTTGQTTVLTVNHTTTVAAQPVLLFGLPPELVAIFTLAIVGGVYFFFKFQVKGVPVSLVWIYKNGSALMLRAQEDLQGIFLTVIKGGKKAETLKKTGLALPVRYTPNNFKAYIETPSTNKENQAMMKDLQNRGYKVTEQPEKKQGRFKKQTIKAYLIEKKAGVESALAYLDVNMGGLKTARLYASIEGTGETIDWQSKIASAKPEDEGNTILLQEMKSAAKGFFALLAEAMQGSFKSFVLPLIAGVGLGATAVFVIVIVSGHLH